MSVEHAARFLLWCAAGNYAVLLVWFGVFILGRDRLYRLHSRWFKIDRERFDAIHYLGMAVYKVLVLVLNVVPLLVLWLAF